MEFQVLHRTGYRYERPVRLGLHRLRLHPRADPGVVLLDHQLMVEPQPLARWQGLDPDGNLVTHLRFGAETRRLVIESRFRLHTRPAPPCPPSWDAPPQTDPYPPALRRRLTPWLRPADEVAREVRALADELAGQATDGIGYLQAVNGHLHHHLKREIREQGPAHAPQETLRRGRGACRDLTELFLALARARGWAGRFVSGYQAHGHPDAARRHMHAWPEVYVPGAGWRGFDPTHGRAVGEAHVALAAAALPADAAPLEGCYFGTAASSLETMLSIRIAADGSPPLSQPE